MTPDTTISSFRNGDHICLFYKNLEEQFATAVPFVKVGLLRGERCLCVLPRKKTELLLSYLTAAGADPRKELECGALLMLTPEEAYLKGGSFNREQMVKMLDDGMRESLKVGFTGFRGCGDLTWAVTDSNACGQLVDYEAMLDRYYPGKPSLGICMYDATAFAKEHLEQLMESHRLALTNPSRTKRSIRIRNGQAFGDVVFDRASASLFHYTVQKERNFAFTRGGTRVITHGSSGCRGVNAANLC